MLYSKRMLKKAKRMLKKAKRMFAASASNCVVGSVGREHFKVEICSKIACF
jgi:hypothetical protein